MKDDLPLRPLKRAQYHLAALLLLPSVTFAHSFGTAYNLPVPFWMYAYGASATLAVSFGIVAYFAGVPISVDRVAVAHVTTGWRIPDGLLALLRTLSVALLALCIATGLFGTRNVYTNFNMTFFWIVFALGFLYASALIGDLYALVNPWRALCDALVALLRSKVSLAQYPSWLEHYPALVLYAGFIWFELFGQSQPFSLALVLIVYTAINLAGAALFGREAWFHHGEFFAVLFRLVGRMAPVFYVPERDGAWSIAYRKPLVGILDEPAGRMSLLLFVLFMLSSTAFDGLHDTLPWVTIFWKHIFPALTAGSNLPYSATVDYYYYWQWAMLVFSPFLYLAVYLAFIAASKVAAGSNKDLRTLALAFTFSLVPIAFVYNVTHYFTLLVSQGTQIVRIASDPFGWHWNLLGSTMRSTDPVILDAGTVWHTQVALILIGHILGVCLSHLQALRVFRGTRRAVVSQLPMLFLMIIFTTVGLWILSLPIAGGQVIVPSG